MGRQADAQLGFDDRERRTFKRGLPVDGLERVTEAKLEHEVPFIAATIDRKPPFEA